MADNIIQTRQTMSDRDHPSTRNNAFKPGVLLLVFLILAGFICATYSPVIFGGRTLFPLLHRAELSSHPHQNPGDPAPDSEICVDPGGAMMISYCWDAYTKDVLRSGNIPLWNPYTGLGQPLLQNGLSAVLHPAKILQFFVPHRYWDIIYLFLWCCCGYFIYLWLAEMGASIGEALFGAAMILTASHFALYLMLRDVLITCATLPLLLFGIERTLRNAAWRWRHLVLSFSLYAIVTGGQASVILALIVALPLYIWGRLLSRRGELLASFWALLPGLLAGVLLSSPHWINFADHAFGESYSSRNAAPGLGECVWPMKWVGGMLFPWLAGRLFENPFKSMNDWTWDMFPGWFSSVQGFTLFAGLIGICCFRDTMRKGFRNPVFLSAMIGCAILLKVLGVPPFSYLGSLPLFNMAIWPRYATPVALIFLASVSPLLLRWLWKKPQGFWISSVCAWILFAVVCAYWSFSVPMEDAARAGPKSEEALHVRTFFAGGLLWTILPIVTLLIARLLKCSLPLAFTIGILAVSMQAAAFAPFGYSLESYKFATWLAAGIFVFLSAGAIALDHFQSRLPFPVLGIFALFSLMAVGSIPLIIQSRSEKSLSRRFDPLATAPYMNVLDRLHHKGKYRTLAVEGTPGPNFALPHQLSTLNNMDCLVMYWAARFHLLCLDPGTQPYWFAGDFSIGRKGSTFESFQQNHQWFNFSSVRFFQSKGATPNRALLENWKPGEPRRKVTIKPNQPVRHTFSSPADSIPRIDILLSDSHKTLPGSLVLEVLDQDGTICGKSIEQTSRFADRTMHPFHFSPPISTSVNQLLNLRLTFEPEGDVPKNASLGYYRPRTEGGGNIIFSIPNLIGGLPEIYSAEEGNMRIWENKDAKPRVFRVPHFEVETDNESILRKLSKLTAADVFQSVYVDKSPDNENPTGYEETQSGEDELFDFDLTPNSLTFRYRAAGPGVLVVSDAYHRDWKATVNKQQESVLRVNSAFRGIHIPKAGEYHVTMKYQPRFWNISIFLAVLGVIIVFIMTFTSMRRFS